ncbi:MAG: serine/threonine protein kinase [Polyangiaceae bacterium]|nr:serine/threonine protein kinase [Polyangiaceae bacterium]MCW5792256.1 serine/threonine protein kinase [Polyangiaceae bacterium]
MSLTAGTQVGDYRVVSRLGEGASGAVYVAEPVSPASSRLGARRVALKVLHPHLATDHQLTRRFEREARILRQLSGEHLVPVLDVGRAGDRLYMALELVQGVSLDLALRHARPTPEQAIRILMEVCAALEAAHAAGAIHRDLKPSNIMLEIGDAGGFETRPYEKNAGGFEARPYEKNAGGFEARPYEKNAGGLETRRGDARDAREGHKRGAHDANESRRGLDEVARAFEEAPPGAFEAQAAELLASGRVKVLDFGMAKLVRGDSGTSVTALTEQNMVFGTPEYMSPEQAKGEEVDSTTDVYAAGIILYELITGRLPFQKATAIGTMTAQLTESPTPPSERDGAVVTPALEAVILHALAKDPDQRYPTAGDLRVALQRADEAPLDADAAAPVSTLAHSDTQRALYGAITSARPPSSLSSSSGAPELQAVSLDPAQPTARGSVLWLSLALIAALLSIVAGVAVSMSLS